MFHQEANIIRTPQKKCAKFFEDLFIAQRSIMYSSTSDAAPTEVCNIFQSLIDLIKIFQRVSQWLDGTCMMQVVGKATSLCECGRPGGVSSLGKSMHAQCPHVQYLRSLMRSQNTYATMTANAPGLSCAIEMLDFPRCFLHLAPLSMQGFLSRLSLKHSRSPESCD